MDTKKEKALLCLLSGGSREQAAKKAGITTRTLRNYFRDDDFRQEYNDRLSEMLTDACAEGKRLLRLSFHTLEHAAQHADSDATRVSAARILIEQTLRLSELNDVLTRLDALEKRMEDYDHARD